MTSTLGRVTGSSACAENATAESVAPARRRARRFMTTPPWDRPADRGDPSAVEAAERGRHAASRGAGAKSTLFRPSPVECDRAAPFPAGVANRVRLRYGRGCEADARGVRGSGFAGDVLGSGWRRPPSWADPTRRPPTLLRRTWSPTSRKCLPRARATRARHRLPPSRRSGRRQGGGDAPAGYGRGYGRGPVRGPRRRRGGNVRARGGPDTPRSAPGRAAPKAGSR